MAVDPPGPREGALRSADLLVFGGAALDDAALDEIAGLDGVAAVTPISLAQVTIENRAVNVAAVDPATYRLFTVREVADEAGDLGPRGRGRARRPAGPEGGG